eukprot:6213332-Pleurochrysis_carterae.AAC.2
MTPYSYYLSPRAMLRRHLFSASHAHARVLDALLARRPRTQWRCDSRRMHVRRQEAAARACGPRAQGRRPAGWSGPRLRGEQHTNFQLHSPVCIALS